MSTTTPPRGLYLITPDIADDAQLLARTRPLLDSGAVTWLQYRNKSPTMRSAIAEPESVCFQNGSLDSTSK